MATLYAKLVTASTKGNAAAFDSVPVGESSIVTSGTSQRLDFNSPQQDSKQLPKQYYWMLTPVGGNVWVKFSKERNLAAAVGDDWLLKDGETRTFAINGTDLQHVAVIDAT